MRKIHFKGILSTKAKSPKVAGACCDRVNNNINLTVYARIYR